MITKAEAKALMEQSQISFEEAMALVTKEIEEEAKRGNEYAYICSSSFRYSAELIEANLITNGFKVERDPDYFCISWDDREDGDDDHKAFVPPPAGSEDLSWEDA